MNPTRQDLILATIRTAVPGAIGWGLAQLIAAIPAVADIIATVDGVLATSAPGFTVTVILNLVAVGLVIAAYYRLVRELGRRWPIVERFLLGSAKQPVAYIDAGSADQGPVTITSLPASDIEQRTQDALLAKYAAGLGLDRRDVTADFEAIRARLELEQS